MSISKKSNSFSCEAFLSFTTQPSAAAPNAAFGCVVTVVDTHGVACPNYTGDVVISKASGTGTLSGTLTVAAVAGVATFDNLMLDTVGTFTLAANATDPTTGTVLTQVASNSFVVSNTYTMTMGISAPDDSVGFDSNIALGSLSPATWHGGVITRLVTTGNLVAALHTYFSVTGTFSQTDLTSMNPGGGGGATLLSVNANSFTQSGGQTIWRWDNAASFQSDGSNPCHPVLT